MSLRLASVNIGRPELLPGKAMPTGILKRPVAVPVAIGPLGLAGDAVLDKKYHGGPDQAVYLYLQADYDWWEAELGRALPPGTFGENLTIAGLVGDTLGVGDRFTIGTTVLEVTLHRTPCSTFAKRMGDPRWVKRFQQAGRPGAYLRVITPGAVTTGDAVSYAPFAGPSVTVAELLALDGQRTIAPETLRRALASPLHPKLRAGFERRLAAME